MNNRVVWLDALKGFGIFFIMMSHLYFFPTAVSFGYGFIPLFFLAAGYTYKPKPFAEGILQKAKRLLIPYAFYSVLIIIGCFIINTLFHKDVSIGKDVFGALYARACIAHPYVVGETKLIMGDNQPLWFLPCMFVMYLYLSAYRSLNSKLGGAFIVIVIVLTFAVQNIPYQLPWSLDLALMSILFFLVSYKFRDQVHKVITTSGFEANSKMVDSLLSVLLLTLACLAYYWLTKANGSCNMSVRNYGGHGLLSLPVFFIIGCLYTYIISKVCYLLENTVFMRFMAYLGSQSLRLMCIHIFLAYEVFSRIPGHELINEHVLPFVYIGLVIIVNYVIDIMFGKLKNNVSVFKYL